MPIPRRKLVEACLLEALHRKLSKDQEELKLICFWKLWKQLLEEGCFRLRWVVLKLLVDKLPFEDVLQQAGWKRVSFVGKQHLDKLLMLEADHLCFKLVAEADAEAGEARREATSLSKAG